MSFDSYHGATALGLYLLAPLGADLDKMYRADLILGVTFMVGLLVVTLGAWKIMRSLRTISGKMLFWSLAIFYAWAFFSETLFFAIFSYFDSEVPYKYIDSSRIVLRVGVPAALVLSIAVNFFLVAVTVSRNCKTVEDARRLKN